MKYLVQVENEELRPLLVNQINSADDLLMRLWLGLYRVSDLCPGIQDLLPDYSNPGLGLHVPLTTWSERQENKQVKWQCNMIVGEMNLDITNSGLREPNLTLTRGL